MIPRALAAGLAFYALGGCATLEPPAAERAAVTLDFVSPADGPAQLRFETAQPVRALHFTPALGAWRSEDWRIADPGLRWAADADADRLERIDGAPFGAVRIELAQRYRPLIVSYAPFAPFSDGGLLVYSGHYHACAALPCSGDGPVTMRIAAPGRTIRAGDTVGTDRLTHVSRGEGSHIYIGNRTPETAGGMSAIVDPGLPADLHGQLERSLPAAIAYFAERYGPLSFRPQLFVSIDTRGRGDGNESTQGGTLPRQVFMHFDGAKARERLAQQEPGWLDWFFAHEVAHMVQRDQSGDRIGDTAHAWMHEGGADAMAALTLRAQGMGAHVDTRLQEAAVACRAGLARGPLDTATARGDFELHYACGPIAALAIDRDLRTRGSGLDDFNRRWFAALATPEGGGQAAWFAAARASGVSEATLALVSDLTGANAAKAQAALDRLDIATETDRAR